jgi:transposase-like protein
LQLAGFTLAELEKLAIVQTLQQFDGNRTKAARALGISVRTLQRKLRMWRTARRSSAGGTTTEASGSTAVLSSDRTEKQFSVSGCVRHPKGDQKGEAGC